MREILITKANGELEPFDGEKLRQSLMRSGAAKRQADQITSTISRRIKPGDSTGKIYKEAFAHLKKLEKGVAARYSLRRALADLGPSGFPFEVFVARLFEQKGFSTEVGLHLKGKCSIHEVDLIAKNDQKIIMGEVKFHNNSDIKNDTKIVLYIHARYLDLTRSNFDGHNPDNLKSEGWFISNTKFTENTINYANCYGLRLLGWNYPYNDESLQTLIEDNNLEPVTILTTLSPSEKAELMKREVVLCRGLKDNMDILKDLRIGRRRQNEIVTELSNVCKI